MRKWSSIEVIAMKVEQDVVEVGSDEGNLLFNGAVVKTVCPTYYHTSPEESCKTAERYQQLTDFHFIPILLLLLFRLFFILSYNMSFVYYRRDSLRSVKV